MAGWNQSTARTTSSIAFRTQSDRLTCSSSWHAMAVCSCSGNDSKLRGTSTTGQSTPQVTGRLAVADTRNSASVSASVAARSIEPGRGQSRRADRRRRPTVMTPRPSQPERGGAHRRRAPRPRQTAAAPPERRSRWRPARRRLAVRGTAGPRRTPSATAATGGRGRRLRRAHPRLQQRQQQAADEHHPPVRHPRRAATRARAAAAAARRRGRRRRPGATRPGGWPAVRVSITQPRESGAPVPRVPPGTGGGPRRGARGAAARTR